MASSESTEPKLISNGKNAAHSYICVNEKVRLTYDNSASSVKSSIVVTKENNLPVRVNFYGE